MANTTPRRLKLTFEFCVAEGITRNIQDKHLGTAVDKIEAAVRAIGGDAFPWADRLVVKREWNYPWWADSDYENREYKLPPNEFNQPK